MKKMLAKVTGAGLEIKERGVLTFYIHVDYEDGCSQSVGGITLDEFNKEKGKREGSAYGCEMIRQLLIALDVNDFSEMKDMIVWIYGEGDGFSFSPKGIGRLNVHGGGNKQFIFKSVSDEFRGEENQ